MAEQQTMQDRQRLPQQLRLAQGQALIRDKRDLWEAFHRNGFYLPAFGPFITHQYLDAVQSTKVHVPTYSQVRLAPCPRPPPKKVIVEELYRISLHKGMDLGIIPGRKEPDTPWCMHLLSTWAPGHRFFKKSFLPELAANSSRKAKLNERLLVEDAQFFEGLPMQLGKRKKGRTILRPTR